jgi:hypothetical protein
MILNNPISFMIKDEVQELEEVKVKIIFLFKWSHRPSQLH